MRCMRVGRVVAALAAVLAVAGWSPGAASSSRQRGDQEQEHQHQRVHEFEDAERWAERFNDPARDAWQKPDHVVSLLEIDEGMTVADIGAGTGYFVPHLSRAVGASGQVLALDVAEEMVDWLRREMLPELPLDNVAARVVAADDPALAAGSVDRVLIVNTWHHIGDRPAYAARLARALADGGTVAVVDFTQDAESGPPPEMRLTPDEVIAELQAGGLVAELLEEELPRQYVVVGRAAAR